MGKSILYVSDQGAGLHKESERIVIKKDNAVIGEVRTDMIDTVVLFGGVQFTNPVVCLLARHNITLSLCTLSGRLVAKLAPPMSLNIERSLNQFDMSKDPEWKLNSAKNVVLGKLKGYKLLLRHYMKYKATDSMKSALPEIDMYGFRTRMSTQISSLYGIEGSAGRFWFEQLRKLINCDSFDGRNRRPPRDMVNSLLSLFYSLLSNKIANILDGVGLNPGLGFYHANEYGRASLALDLMEEYRSILVDRFVISMVNRRLVDEGDFEDREGGIYLKASELKAVIKHWEGHLMESLRFPWGISTWTEVIMRSIDMYRKCVDSKRVYLPLVLDGAKA